MTFKERIDMILKEFHLTRAEFERLCGLSNGYTRNLGGTPGADKVEKILENFPKINRIWLLTGEGEMLCPNISQRNVSGPNVIGESQVVNNALPSELLALIRNRDEELKARDEEVRKRDEQIDRLLSLLEKFTSNLNP